MNTAIKFIVFDWDGTLMDSQAQIVSCLHAAVADLDLAPMSDATVSNIIGLGLREAIDTLVPGRDEQFHEAFAEAYRTHWYQSESSQLFAGVRSMLDVVREQNFLLGVATGKARRGLDRVLNDTGLGSYFHATRCVDEALSKPRPRVQQLPSPARVELLHGGAHPAKRRLRISSQLSQGFLLLAQPLRLLAKRVHGFEQDAFVTGLGALVPPFARWIFHSWAASMRHS